MLYKNSAISIILSIFLLNSCVKNPHPDQNITAPLDENNKTTKKNAKALQEDIFKSLAHNLDDADEKYVDLKTEFKKSPYVEKSALALAVAHMQQEEFILANFYLQEALKANRSNELAKYLLAKNQFLYAKSVASDQTYLNKAIKALETNRKILKDREYKLLADSMLTRVKLEKVYNNQRIGKLYKKLNKNKAYELYISKTLNLNINPQDIYKP
jgi:outer membrane protein assembly factor BamD